MVRRIHHRLSYMLLVIAGLYLVVGLVMIGSKRGLNYQPNPQAKVTASDTFKANESKYVDYIDWALDTSKNSLPLSANHTARYNLLDLKIVSVILLVAVLSIMVHKKMETSSE